MACFHYRWARVVCAFGTGLLCCSVPANAQTIGFANVILDHPSPQTEARFGIALAAAGDVNKDGVPDVLVGSPWQDVGGNRAQGQAYLFSGADGSLLFTLDDPSPQAWAEFGIAMAGAGDVDNDGASDLVVGAPRQNVGATLAQGRAYVFSGATGSVLRTLDTPNPQAYGFFASAVARLDDANGDGVAELLVSAPGQDAGANTSAGRVFVFSGSNGSLLRTLDHPIPQVNARFGTYMAGAGDVNGDAVPELLVSAYFPVCQS